MISTLLKKKWLGTGRWISPGTPVASTNKTDHHDMTKILLKVAVNIITLTFIKKNVNNIITDFVYPVRGLLFSCYQILFKLFGSPIVVTVLYMKVIPGAEFDIYVISIHS